MVKNREINGTKEIALVTPTPGKILFPLLDVHNLNVYNNHRSQLNTMEFCV